MTSFMQHQISRMRASSVALVLVLAFVATPSAQAQTYTVLYSFTGGLDGSYPYSGVIRDRAGNLYGTTDGGGAYGFGTVFKLDTSGAETVLHSFSGPPDGAHVFNGLVVESTGNLYGTT